VRPSAGFLYVSTALEKKHWSKEDITFKGSYPHTTGDNPIIVRDCSQELGNHYLDQLSWLQTFSVQSKNLYASPTGLSSI